MQDHNPADHNSGSNSNAGQHAVGSRNLEARTKRRKPVVTSSTLNNNSTTTTGPPSNAMTPATATTGGADSNVLFHQLQQQDNSSNNTNNSPTTMTMNSGVGNHPQSPLSPPLQDFDLNPPSQDQEFIENIDGKIIREIKKRASVAHHPQQNSLRHQNSRNNVFWIGSLSGDEALEICDFLVQRLKRDFLALLPSEVAYKILEWVDFKAISVKVRRVSRTWKGLVDGVGADVTLWKAKIIREFPHLMIRPDPLSEKPEERSYKAYYVHHYTTRQNWLLGRFKRLSFPGHADKVVTCLLFDDDKIISGSDDATIHIYDIKNGTLIRRLHGHDGGVWALQAIGPFIVSGSTDRSVRIWDIATGECTHIFEGHTSTVRCLAVLPQDGSSLNVGGGISPSKKRETAQHSQVFPTSVPAGGSRSSVTGTFNRSNSNINNNDSSSTPKKNIKHESEEALIVTGSRDASIRVWKLPPVGSRFIHEGPDKPPNPYVVHTLMGHTGSVRAISGQGNILVSGSYDCSVRVWDVIAGSLLHTCHGHREKVYSVCYSHQLKRAVSGSMDATVRIWDTITGVGLFILDGHASLVGLLELTPQYLISAAADSTLRIWDPMTGKCFASLTGHQAAITCFQHDPASNRIISGSDGGVKVWEISSGGYPGFDLMDTSRVIPKSSDLNKVSHGLNYTQGMQGPEPIYGRFITDAVADVTGVWRTKMDSTRIVSAVQYQTEQTWFEVLDFTEQPGMGTRTEAEGDRVGFAGGEVDENGVVMEHDDDDEDDDEDEDDEDDGEEGHDEEMEGGGEGGDEEGGEPMMEDGE